MSGWYLLDENHDPFPIPMSRAHEMTDKMCRVAYDEIGTYRVSTVFLGIDHSFGAPGGPILFETMVFPHNSWLEVYGDRYQTWEDALAGHQAAIRWVNQHRMEEEE